MLENLRLAAPLAADAGVMLTLGVLNPTDNPGYFLTTLEEARQVVEALNHPGVRMQLDTYHLGLLGYEPAAEIRRHTGWIGHIQFADFPGRHEPAAQTSPVRVFLASMLLMILVGLVGAGLHVEVDRTTMNVWMIERFLRGAPVLAPLLFCNMGALGLIVLLGPDPAT